MMGLSYKEKDAEKSRRAFQQFSSPALKKFFGGAVILSTEGHTKDKPTTIEKSLDISGIDGICVTQKGWTYFYASRVQFGKLYENFSIRYSRPSGKATEFEKLQRANKICAPMPTFHVQCFVDDDGQAARVAIVPTVDLIRHMQKDKLKIRMTDSGEQFCFIPWRELARVKIYRVDASGHVEEITANFTADKKIPLFAAAT